MNRNKFHGTWARSEPGEGKMLQSLQQELSELLDALFSTAQPAALCWFSIQARKWETDVKF